MQSSKSAKHTEDKKGMDWELELKSHKQKRMNNALRIVYWVSRRELVDKVPLCSASLRACMVAPGSGITTTLVLEST